MLSTELRLFPDHRGRLAGDAKQLSAKPKTIGADDNDLAELRPARFFLV
jgi:hypothetical protein